MSFLYNCLDSYFKITERGTSLGTEFRAGTASFFTLSYLLLVNPQIMAEAGVAHDDAVVATAMSAAVSCFVVGFLGNLPFGTAPGIGLSAYLSYSLVQAGLCTLEDALTACFTSGIVLVIVALTGFTTFLMKVVPECVKYGIVVGMGLLIAMIGMVSVHLIVPKDDTLIGLGDMSDLALQLTMVGMLLVGTLIYWDVKGGILIGIAVIAVAQWWIDSDWPTEIAHYPVFNNNNYITPSVMWDSEKAPLLWTAVGVFLLICVFDISGVLFGLATLGGLIRHDGHIPGNIWVFIASATGTITAAFFGSTPIICCVETAAGIKEGGRTGLTAITIGLYFLLALFLAPLFSAIPNDATAPVLILVGVMMMGESAKVEWHDMSQALPAFLTLILMPLTYDITNGMIFGLAAAAGFYFTTGQFFTDMKKVCCSNGEEEYEQFEDASENLTGETTSLLLLQDNEDVQSHPSTIEKAKQLYSPGSERGVDFGAILY
mmetsp:Transcript_51476/g.124284  ORF Transcript_51476/g.124284 Transcript_51476/m.124284 type:complete len:488 (-) Transcript_51476:99-1562(-)